MLQLCTANVSYRRQVTVVTKLGAVLELHINHIEFVALFNYYLS